MRRIHAALSAVAVLLLAPAAVEAAAAVPANGRGWELVTRVDPNGPAPTTAYAIDATGERIAYVTIGPVAGAPVGSLSSANVAVRDSAGWGVTPVGHPYSSPGLFQAPVPVASSSDMSTWIWTSPVPLLPGAPQSPDNGWYRGTTAGALTLLGGNGGALATAPLVGVSDDARHVVFQTAAELLAADVPRTSGDQVYEYVGTNLRLVGVDDGGALLSSCGSVGGSTSLPPNPVSADGERVFFMSPGSACAGVQPSVFVRESGTTTTKVSASRCTRPDCNAAAAVRFMGATPSGSTVFLATAQQLTDDDVDNSQDLYRYDLDGDVLSRVSVGAVAGANVTPTRVYPSDDGSRVYFLARGMLVDGQGIVGRPNVYVADGDGVRFVAALAAGDSWPSGSTGAALEDVQVTPGGERIVFATIASLQADDTDVAKDVYLFDTDDGTLARVSGMPGGGNGALPANISTNGSHFSFNTPRALSSDGRRAFFTTSERLLPEDVNDTLDAYEWVDGSLGLVSSGAGDGSVSFLGASPDGSTAFFSTVESLVGADGDGGDQDLYAARLGGGLPDPEPPPADCAGEACFPPPAGRLSRPSPASLTEADRWQAGRLVVRRPGRSALGGMAARGRIELVVRAPLPGRVSARASARIDRRVRTVARGHATAARRGAVVLRLQLSRSARSRLASGGALSVRVSVRHSRLDRASVVVLTLEGP